MQQALSQINNATYTTWFPEVSSECLRAHVFEKYHHLVFSWKDEIVYIVSGVKIGRYIPFKRQM